ncbi:MAG: DNA repair protein RadA [Omnitrophica WOR_2 bacterium RIFCSPHIGHO2_02_FULL_45_21]|nr:MAG: DNA repair protein RadA [Omnitrophica WOR_2 bacterium RIFCSPHIGHO2_02_FULL_45_21]
MMKTKTIFSCQSCGYQSPKWLGRCPDCSNWNSFVEEAYAEPKAARPAYAALADFSSNQEPVLMRDIEKKDDLRHKTQIGELDRVLGGGIVKGAVVLLGGDPGIGKSTIALQLSNQLSQTGLKILYVSAEESVQQTLMRAERLGALLAERIYIVNQTDLSAIIEYIKKINPDVMIIDSIQVIFSPDISSSPGSVSQVRECSHILTRIAKSGGISMFIIGHVTKEGALAGPRILEHIVDTVLYFEGERYSTYRILRAVKNRFGSTNEIGVFRMGLSGLEEVKNPSEFFLSERPQDAPGSVITSVLEGTRPMLLEVQALVARSSFGYAARRSEGFDYNRLNLLVAVLEKRLGLHLENEDIFINIAGGVTVKDPSCDLAVALAIVSSFKEKIVKKDIVIIGEVGLASEIRNVTQVSLRIKEAQKLGFKQCIIPKNNLDNKESYDIELTGVRNIQEAMEHAF